MVSSTGNRSVSGGGSVNQSSAIDNLSCRSTTPAPDGAAIAHLTTEEISIIQKVLEKHQRFEKETEASRKKSFRCNACRICLKNLQEVDTSTYHLCSQCQQKVCEDCCVCIDQQTGFEKWLCLICKRKQADAAKQAEDLAGQSDSHGQEEPSAIDMRKSLIVNQISGRGEGCDQIISGGELSPRLRPKTLDTFSQPVGGHNSAPQSPSKPFNKIILHEHEKKLVERTTMPSHPHPPLRHFHSDSGGSSGRMAQLASQRLSPDIINKDRSPRSKHSPSTSDSSLDDGNGGGNTWGADNDGEETNGHNWRRKKSKIKRKNRIQRQRSYNDDLQLLPVESERDDEKRRKEQLLDVPGQSKIVRHHSWDATLGSGRRYSSESSDVSDVGGAIEQDEDEDERKVEKSSSVHRKLSRKKRMDSEEDYDATMESSPSPDNTERRAFPPRMDRRTSSEDSDANKSSRRSSGHGSITSQQTWPIPIVEVHEAVSTTADSLLTTCTSGICSSGRSLPKIPDQLLRLTPTASSSSSNSSICTSVAAPRTRQSKSVDLTSLYHNERVTDSLLRRSTLSEFESVKIVIDDVDSNRGADKNGNRPRLVVLKRTLDNDGRASRGFGMRVVGGKAGDDGRLFAYVVWTVPDGPAEINGIIKGDKILEWDGETLVDRTFEEVCVIMDHSGDEVTLLVEHVIDPRSIRHSSFDVGQLQAPEHTHRRSSEGSNIGAHGVPLDLLALEAAKMESLQQQLPSLSPRRRLPKPPPDCTSDLNCGEIQLVMWFEDEVPPVFTVTITEAQDLSLRPDGFTPPEAYAKIRLLPDKNGDPFRTEVAEMSVNPSWNESYTYTGISNDEVGHKVLVISLWDLMAPNVKRSLGELILPLRKSKMDGRAEWYRLRDRRTLVSSSSSKSLLVPGLGAEHQELQRKRSEFAHTRSQSDDIDDDVALDLISHIVKSTSVDANLLRPDQHWNRDRRRSSSGSEKSEASTHSCPPLLSARRNYFMNEVHSGPAEAESLSPSAIKVQPPAAVTTNGQWRTRSFKLPRQESLQQIKNRTVNTEERLETVSNRLARSFSLRGDRRCVSMGAKDYLTPPTRSRWSSSSSLDGSDDENDITQTGAHRTLDHSDATSLKLGPAQVWPKNFTGLPGSTLREIKLGLIISKGYLEIDVICARGLGHSAVTGQTPDTYVKTYLKDGERYIQKKKTRVVRHSLDPCYKQTLRYAASEVTHRLLLVMVWEKQKGFDHNHGVGVAHINPDQLELNQLLIGWYRLFPMGKIVNESESNESN
ncbi:hypothetical protein CHUAL_004932 [Chamberlinius hualienensis]